MPDKPHHRQRTVRGETPGSPPMAWRLDALAEDPTLPLLVGLHGWGLDEDQFARLLRPLMDRPLRILLPRAPLPLTGSREGREGASWYDYDGDQDRFRAVLEESEGRVLDLVRSVEREQGLAPRHRWLLGFSQGGYCGSWIATRAAGFFDGMIIVGARVKTEWLAADMARAAESGFEALLCHGRQDLAVPPEAAERSLAGLEAAGVPVELQWFDSGHTLGRGQVEAIAGWLEERISGKAGRF